jgi:hypothetical protein
MPLEPNDQRHLTCAEGYAELGLVLDANAELECISPDWRHASEVLIIRARICAKLEKWELLQGAAKRLALREPDNSKF